MIVYGPRKKGRWSSLKCAGSLRRLVEILKSLFAPSLGKLTSVLPSSSNSPPPVLHQGQSYPEGLFTAIDYQCDIPVASGPAPQTEIEIFCNDDAAPPVHCTPRTRCIARLSLNLERIPASTKSAAGITRIGNHRYHCLTGAIEASYGSAMITYKVKLGGEFVVLRD